VWEDSILQRDEDSNQNKGTKMTVYNRRDLQRRFPPKNPDPPGPKKADLKTESLKDKQKEWKDTGASPKEPKVLSPPPIPRKAATPKKKPKVEKPKASAPKKKPKVEEPKVEEPKVEEPKVEEPKVEEAAPEPKVEEPKVEEPKVEEPKVEEPKVEEPKVEEPKVEEPKELPKPEAPRRIKSMSAEQLEDLIAKVESRKPPRKDFTRWAKQLKIDLPKRATKDKIAELLLPKLKELLANI
jgi:hypothetical protein